VRKKQTRKGDYPLIEEQITQVEAVTITVSAESLQNRTDALTSEDNASVPVRSDKAQKLLRPKAAARPIGLLHRIAMRRGEFDGSHEEDPALLRQDVSVNIKAAIGPRHAKDEIEPEAADTASMVKLDTPNAAKTGASSESVEDQVESRSSGSKHEEEVVKEAKEEGEEKEEEKEVSPTPMDVSVKVAMAMAGKENQSRSINTQKLVGHESAKLSPGLGKMPSRSRSRTPFGNIDMNARPLSL